MWFRFLQIPLAIFKYNLMQHRFFLLLLCSNLFVVGNTQAQEIITINGNGESKNRIEALSRAKENALIAAMQQQLTYKTELDALIYSKNILIRKGLRLFKIEKSTEKSSHQNYSQIEIKASIPRDKLCKLLSSEKIFLKSMNKPKLFVIIDESILKSHDASLKFSETSILNHLTETLGFTFVEPSISTSIRTSRQKTNYLFTNNKNAAQVGSQYGADFIILGTASSNVSSSDSTEKLGGMITVVANVELSVINCATSQIVANTIVTDNKFHFSPQTASQQAIVEASKQSVIKVIDPLMISWNLQQIHGIALDITIDNVTTIRSKKAIVHTLQAIDEILLVKEQSWNQDDKTLILDIQYKGSISDFCHKLNKFRIKSGRGTLAITGTNGSKISFINQVL